MASSSNLGLCILFIFLPVGCVCMQDEQLHNHVPLFTFGDSSVDTGNNNYIKTRRIAQANYPPYGQTFLKYPSGRWSDGRVLPDFFSEYADLPWVLPYLHPGNKRYVYGTNFASGGAGALHETNQGLVISLKTQVKNYKKVERILRKQLGKTGVKTILSRGVYLISIGTNDYSVYASDTKLSISYSLEKYFDLVIGNLTSVINEIHKKGGRKFVVMNLWSPNHIPAVQEAVPSQGRDARLGQLNQLVELHNGQLYKELQRLTTKLKGFRYSYADSYKVVEEITSSPAKYGFKDVKVACCGSGKLRGIQTCGGQDAIKEYQLCEDPKEHLFFDSNHWSDRGCQILAEMIWNGDLDTSRPINVKSLFHS